MADYRLRVRDSVYLYSFQHSKALKRIGVTAETLQATNMSVIVTLLMGNIKMLSQQLGLFKWVEREWGPPKRETVHSVFALRPTQEKSVVVVTVVVWWWWWWQQLTNSPAFSQCDPAVCVLIPG